MKAVAGMPRFTLATLPTPLVRAHRLEARLGTPPVYVKRDDLAGFGAAGHKARQLEFLLGAAIAARCDVIVVGGGPSSNFCPAAAAAAVVAGLDCEIVLYGNPPERPHPNLAAAEATGARLRFTGDPDREGLDATITTLARQLEAEGRRPYAIPRGGATPTGAVGLVVAAEELAGQLDTADVEPAAVVVATGSGGACAGLAVGARAVGAAWEVVGASVSRPLPQACAQVGQLASACAALIGVPWADDARVRLIDAVGPGFGLPSAEGEAASTVALRSEGMILDPVYTAKAFAVLLRLATEGAGRPLVFWHTGGLLAAAAHLARGALLEERA